MPPRELACPFNESQVSTRGEKLKNDANEESSMDKIWNLRMGVFAKTAPCLNTMAVDL